MRGDLGWRKEEPEFKIFNVRKQMETAKSEMSAQHINANVFYLIQNPAHLLTDWAPIGPGLYDFPDKFFAKCDRPIRTDQNEVNTPGECVVGGRTGYSIKIVSRDYLLSADLELGGPGIRGRIKNPPPSSDEF